MGQFEWLKKEWDALDEREREQMLKPTTVQEAPDISPSTDLKLRMGDALQRNPQQEAKVASVSRATGLPHSLVRDDVDELSRRQWLASIDWQAIDEETPALGRLLRRGNNAELLKDDLPQMRSVAGLMREGRVVPQFWVQAASRIPEFVKQGWIKGRATLELSGIENAEMARKFELAFGMKPPPSVGQKAWDKMTVAASSLASPLTGGSAGSWLLGKLAQAEGPQIGPAPGEAMGPQTEEDQRALDQIQKRREVLQAILQDEMPPDDGAVIGFIQRGSGGFAQFVPTMIEGLKQRMIGGATGAVVATAGAAAVGAAIPAPEEAATLPLAAAGGFTVGSAVGGVKFGVELETGLIYADLRKLSEEDVAAGGQGFTETEMQSMALVFGAFAGGLELIGLNTAARVTGIREIIRRSTTQSLRKAFQRKGFKEGLKNLGKGWLESAVVEPLTETGQDAMAMSAEQWARWFARNRGHAETWGEFNWKDQVPQLADTYMQTLESMIVGGPLMGSGKFVAETRGPTEETRVRKAVAQLDQLALAMNGVKAAVNDPEGFEQQLKQLTEERGSITHVHVPLDAFNAIAAKHGIAPVDLAAKIMGDDGKHYQEQSQWGSTLSPDIIIPIERYLTKVAPTAAERSGLTSGLHNDFLPNMRLYQGDPTLVEVRQADQEKIESLLRMAEALKGEVETDALPANEQKIFDEEVNRALPALEERGIEDPAELAKVVATIQLAKKRRWSERTGMSVDQIHEQYRFNVLSDSPDTPILATKTGRASTALDETSTSPEAEEALQIAAGLRDNRQKAIDQAAAKMATQIPAGRELIPAPDPAGAAGRNEKLVAAIQEARGQPEGEVLFRGSALAELPTTAVSESINTTTFGDVKVTRHGIFLSSSERFASEFGEVRKVRAAVSSTADVEAVKDEFIESLDPFDERDLWLLARETRDLSVFFDGELGDRFVAFLKKEGYDSARFEETIQPGQFGDEGAEAEEVTGETLVVFDPEALALEEPAGPPIIIDAIRTTGDRIESVRQQHEGATYLAYAQAGDPDVDLKRLKQTAARELGVREDALDFEGGMAEGEERWLKHAPQRAKSGKQDILGAPEWVNAPKTAKAKTTRLRELRKLLRQLTNEGESGRFWYEQSARKVMELAKGNLADAEKIISLLAIYSANTGIYPNTWHAINVWTHYKKGGKAEDLHAATGVQDAKARELLYGTGKWTTPDAEGRAVDGRKINSFYRNLMHVLVAEATDEQLAEINMDSELIADIRSDVIGLANPATVDIWILRVFGYERDQIGADKGTGRYSFAEDEIRHLTAQLNHGRPHGTPRWMPHQVQAAMWSAIKARQELPSVKSATIEESVKKGYSDFARKVDGKVVETGRVKKNKQWQWRAPTNPEARKKHQAIWRKHALAASEADVLRAIEQARLSFGDTFTAATHTVPWEAHPSNTALGLEISTASPELKEAYAREMVQLIMDEHGNDLLAGRLGVILNRIEQQTGAYAGLVSPEFLAEASDADARAALATNFIAQLTQREGSGEFDRTTAQAYARAIQYIYRQDAVPIYRADARLRPADDGYAVYYNGRMVSNSRRDTYNAANAHLRELALKHPDRKYEVRGGVGPEVTGKDGKTKIKKVTPSAQGVRLVFDHALTEPEQVALLRALQNGVSENVGYTKIRDNEVHVINFRDDDDWTAFKPWLMNLEDREFIERMSMVVERYGKEAGITESQAFGIEGQYGPVVDWADSGAERQAKAAVADSAGAAGQPGIQRWVAGRAKEARRITAERWSGEALKERAQEVAAARDMVDPPMASPDAELKKVLFQIHRDDFYDLPAPTTDTFRKWFEGSKVVDQNGRALVLFHGTTHKITEFDLNSIQANNFMGRAIYLTSSAEDAGANYADTETSPDLQNRIMQLAEALADNVEVLIEDPEDREDRAMEIAREMLVGDSPSVIPVFANLKNPADLRVDSPDQTTLTYSEEFDEDGEPVGEPTGTLIEFLAVLDDVASQYEGVEGTPSEAVISEFGDMVGPAGEAAIPLWRIVDYLGEGLVTWRLRVQGKIPPAGRYPSSGVLINAFDENGEPAVNEIIREALEGFGFDGVIHDANLFTMPGITDQDVHVLAFRPEQVKSAFNFAPTDDKRLLFQREYLTLSEEERAIAEDPRPDEELSTPDLLRRSLLRTTDQIRHETMEAEMEAIYEMVGLSRADRKMIDEGVARAARAVAGKLSQRRRGKPRGMIDLSKFASNREANIHLLEGANWSTVLHEFFHGNLEIMADMAEHPAADPQLKKDWATLLRAVGAKNRRDLWTKQLAAERAGKGEQGPIEQLATMWEEYMHRGQAPSIELRAVFAKIRAYMLKVYGEVKKYLRLTPEVAQVFDRMLASDEDAKAAIADLSLQQIPHLNELASPAEAEAYRAQAKRVADNTAIKAQAAMLRESAEEFAKTLEDTRVETRAQVEAEFAAIPLMRALNYLGRGRVPSDLSLAEPVDDESWTTSLPKTHVDDAGKPFKLSREAIVSRYGEDAVRALPHGVYRLKGGLSADEMAPLVGFESGDELISRLRGAPTYLQAVEQAVNKRMEAALSQFEDMEKRRDEVLAAATGPEGIEQVLTELRLIGKKLGREARRVVIDRAGLKALAEQTVSMMAVGALKPNLFRRRAETAGTAAFRAAESRNYERAYTEKLKQAWNMEMFRQTRDAAKFADSTIKRARDMGRPSYRKILGKADSTLMDAKGNMIGYSYTQAMESVLDQFILTQESATERRKRIALGAWAKQAMARNEEVVIPEAILENVDKRHYSELTVQELRDVRTSIDNIYHLARKKVELKVAGKRREWADIVEEGLGRIAEAVRRRKKIPFSPSEREAAKGIRYHLSVARSQLLKIEPMIQRMDGGDPLGPFHQMLWNPIADAGARESDMITALHERIAKIISDLPRETRVRLFGSGAESKVFIEGIGQTMTWDELLAVGANVGNEGNTQRLFDGHWVGYPKMGPPVIEEMLRKLDENRENWEVIQKFWDAIESLWPEMEAMEKRLHGIAPEKVKPRAFTRDLKDGTTITLRGGYWPVVFDKDLGSTKGQLQQEAGADTSTLYAHNHVKAMPAHGHLMNRAQEVHGEALLFVFGDTVIRHIQRAVHDLTHREALNDAWRYLHDPNISHAIIEHMGEPTWLAIRQWLKDLAGEFDPPRDEFGGPFLARVRRNATMAILGFKATIPTQNFINFGNVSERISQKFLLPAFARAMGPQIGQHPVAGAAAGAVLGGAIGGPVGAAAGAAIGATRGALEAMIERVNAKSGEMRNRFRNLDRDMRDAQRALDSRVKLGKVSEYRANVERMAFMYVIETDKMMAYPAWEAAYEQALAGEASLPRLGRKIPAGDEEAAVRWADEVIRLTLASGAQKDLAGVQRVKTERAKWMTFAYTWMSGAFVRADTWLSDMRHDYDRGELRNMVGRGALKLPYYLGRFFAWAVFPSIMASLIVGRGPDQDDDETWYKWAATELAQYQLGMIPLVREASNTKLLGGHGTVRFGFVGRMFEDASAFAIQLGKYPLSWLDVGDIEPDEPDKVVKTGLQVTSRLFWFPGAAQTSVSAQYWWNVYQGIENPESVFEFMRRSAFYKRPQKKRQRRRP